jgi:hypothetical protein
MAGYAASFWSEVQESKWRGRTEGAVSVGTWIWSAWLWASEAPRWQFGTVTLLASFATVLLVYDHGRIAWEKVQKDLTEARSVVAKADAIRAVKSALGDMANRFSLLQQECFVHTRHAKDLHADLVTLSNKTIEFVNQFFDGGEAALFNPTVVVPPDEAAQKMISEGFREHSKLYMIAQLHAQRLHTLIAKMPTQLGR